MTGKLRVSLLVVLLIAGVTGGVAQGARLLEGDPKWDCRTMGNRSCGTKSPLAQVSGLIEGDAGWDCATMGNGSCASTATASTASGPPTFNVAPPFNETRQNDHCRGDHVHCEASSSADLQTGALTVTATAVGTDAQPQDGAWAERVLEAHDVVESPAKWITYFMTIDVDYSEFVPALPTGQSYAEVQFGMFYTDGIIRCMPQQLQQRTLPQPQEFRAGDIDLLNFLGVGAQRLPVDPIRDQVVIEQTMLCREVAAPFNVVDVPAGIDVSLVVEVIAWAYPAPPAGAAHASVTASRTSIVGQAFA